MSAGSFNPRDLIVERDIGILATLHADGRPQLSPVLPFYDPVAEILYISSRDGLVKTSNLRADPRAAYSVTSADGWSWATAEGPATITGPGTDPHGEVVEALVAYYRQAAGEHPDWDEYRSAMVTDRRVLIMIDVQHLYGQSLRSS